MKPESLIRRRCRDAGISYDDLVAGDQSRPVSRVRQDVALELRERACLRLEDIARLIGRTSHVDAVYAIRAARRRRGHKTPGRGVGLRPR